MLKELYGYILANKFLYENQFGFQPGKSTIHPMKITDYICEALDDNDFFLLRKAFDVIGLLVILESESNL